MKIRRNAPSQICTICGTAYPLTELRCKNCGAPLPGDLGAALPSQPSPKPIPPPTVKRATGTLPKASAQSMPIVVPPTAHDDRPLREGEEDLLESTLPALPSVITFGGCAVLLVAILLLSAGGGYLLLNRPSPTSPGVVMLPSDFPLDTSTPLPSKTPLPAQIINTIPPVSTLTPLPPTSSWTPVFTLTPLPTTTLASTATRPRATVPPTNTPRNRLATFTPTPITPTATDAIIFLTAPPVTVSPTITVVTLPVASPTNFIPPPTLDLPSVTPAPPTPTLTPTRGPCVQKVKSGDTLYGLAARCGNYGVAVIQVILDENNLKDTGSLQIGQEIVIPWPTPTGAAPSAADGSGSPGAFIDTEPTLPPGQAWHVVKQGEGAVSIALKYNITVSVLKDLNPEISSSFIGCNFQDKMGGSECSVLLSIGQKVRVTVPLPTPTRSRTPNGSETATPTFTPTFNAPFLLSPGHNLLIEANVIPVLRWGATDRLGANQVYIVYLTNKTTGRQYNIATRELFYPIPIELQGLGGRSEFEWQIGVGIYTQDRLPTPTTFITEKRTFIWIGR